MGVGLLRRHRENEIPEPITPPAELTVDELKDELSDFGVTDADLEPGSGADGNVVRADRVEALEGLRAGEDVADVLGGDEAEA